MKVVTIVGARPQFVKAAALARAFQEVGGVTEVIVHTGQHFDKNMSDVFFEEMQIPHPKYNLAINSLSHGAMTGRMIEKIEEVLLTEKPDFLLVYGDTNSTLAGAIAASKIHIPVVHVEAGLRSFNMEMPEEVNRILTDRISTILFCPTERAVQNLQKEGYDNIDAQVVRSGDVMEDAAKYYDQFAAERATVLESHSFTKDGYYLCTLHRAENTSSLERMKEITTGLNAIASFYPVVLPVHPRTKDLLISYELHENITIIDPVGYFDMISLIKNARLVVTDSGGLQKEAYFFNKFCVTARDQTEWVELVEHGFNQIVGANGDKLKKAVEHFESRSFSKGIELYGGGKAALYIAEYLKNFSRWA
ncbi:MAG: UDP-N-acetylglucosamine 2-epimerase (non-hydrolyzing) [Saprospiraceae bacterium]